MEILTNGKLRLAEIKTEPKSKATSKRAEAVEYFVAAINGDRLSRKMKPYPISYIAYRMAHMPTDDLYPFFKDCLRYEKEGKGSFSKAWFGQLKVKNDAKSK